MHRKIGISCIMIGVICLFASAGWSFYNQMEEEKAKQLSESLLQIAQKELEQGERGEQWKGMETIQIDGYDCMGILNIPVLEIELPVLTEWSYEKLRKAPCHYYGSYHEGDFVIAAHNYATHFGRLSELLQGDLVLFTDAVGTQHCYEVVLLETLSPTATEEMIASGFDLSLYTCTPGGGNRVTVRCKKVQ